MAHELYEGHAGSTLRRLREAADLSLREAAAIAGCSKSYLTDVEHGRKTPTDLWIARVTGALAMHLARGTAA